MPKVQVRDVWLRDQLGALPPIEANAESDPLTWLFGVQRLVLASTSRFKALLCGRRGGKTSLIDSDLAHGLLTCPESENLFMALTTESARANMWRPLIRLDRKCGLGFKFDHSKMTVTNPRNGAVLQVRGSETLRDLEKPRGNGYRRIRLDECGAWRPTYLEYALSEVLEASLMDYEESDLWLSGTCGRIAVGPFYEATRDGHGEHNGWECFGWTAWDNPSLDANKFVFGPCNKCIEHPRPEHVREFVGFSNEKVLGCAHGLLARKNWTLDSPQFRREYLAEWVLDESSLVYRFSRDRNTIAALPALVAGDSWVTAIGLDFGVGDRTACYVLVWPRHYGRAVYVIGGWSQSGLAPSEACDLIDKTRQEVQAQFGTPPIIIGDTGGLGKAYWAEWNRRFGDRVKMHAADKRDKRGTLEFVSDALYTASSAGPITEHRGLLSLAGNTELHRQWASLQWDEDREDIAEGQDDDDADAAMYAFKLSPAFKSKTKVPDSPATAQFPWQRGLIQAPSTKLEKSFKGAFRRGRPR